MQKHTGPMLIAGSLFFLGLSVFFIVQGVIKTTSEGQVVGTVNGYGYTNLTCIVCQTVFHGYPNCKEYPHSGSIKLVFNNCSDVVPVNVCGETPDIATKNTEKMFKMDSTVNGYTNNCEFHFFRSDGWEYLGMGIFFFTVFLILLSIGIYFARKFHRMQSATMYQSV